MENAMIALKLSRIKLFLIYFSFTFLANASNEGFSFEDAHCVAWKTKKKILIFKSLEPVGINCSIKAKFKRKDTGYYIEVSVPIEKFDSNEPMRDKEVSKILKANIRPNLIIETEAHSLQHWKFQLKSNNFKNNLNIKIANRSFILETNAKREEKKGLITVKGKVITSFSSLSLKPPGFAWGLITKVSDYLELYYNIDISKIEGFKKALMEP